MCDLGITLKQDMQRIFLCGFVFGQLMRSATCNLASLISSHLNSFNANGISHSYQLGQSISILRVVGWYFSFSFKILL